MLNSEVRRIADQLRRAFSGDPWHGPPLRDLLANVSAEGAQARPLEGGHTIWELVLHIDIYVGFTIHALNGVAMPKVFGTELDWPQPAGGGDAWTGDTDRLFRNGEQLARTIEGLPDARLGDTVPGRQYDFYYLFHGIVQHSLYHGGQIAILKKAIVAA